MHHVLEEAQTLQEVASVALQLRMCSRLCTVFSVPRLDLTLMLGAETRNQTAIEPNNALGELCGVEQENPVLCAAAFI